MSAELQFKQIIDRILRCREAEDAAKEDTKEVYAELKALGYDKTAAGALVAELRKKDKNPDKFEERNATLDLYRDAYDRASGTGLATHTHAPDPKLIETVVKGVQTETGRKALVAALDVMIEREEANEYAAAKGAETAGSSSGRIAEFDSADAGSNPAPATNTPVPVPPEVDGGQPHPSTDEAPAGQGSDHNGQSVHQSASAAQDRNEPVSASGASAPISDAGAPAFLKPKKDGCLQSPCKVSWTSALCSACANAAMKAKVA